MLLLTLRGTPFLYYGEEIGMRNVEIPPELLQDPIGRTLHPKLARDGERTPMQWTAGPGAGFTTGRAWLPFAPDAAERNVEAQRADPGSLLHLYRDLLALRRATPALARGSYRPLPAPAGVFAFERQAGASRARVALNFGARARRIDLADGAARASLSTVQGRRPPPPKRLDLAPAEGVVVVLG
jgi:alpha-glucosidase